VLLGLFPVSGAAIRPNRYGRRDLTRLAHLRGQYFTDERLIRFPFFSAVSPNHDSTLASKRIAMSFLGSSPTVGRLTRRSRDSCLSESSGYPKNQSSSTSYLFLSLRLARRALMIRVTSSSSLLLMAQALHSKRGFFETRAPMLKPKLSRL
jgi:hypothetical protein